MLFVCIYDAVSAAPSTKVVLDIDDIHFGSGEPRRRKNPTVKACGDASNDNEMVLNRGIKKEW